MRKILFAVLVGAGTALPAQAHETGVVHEHFDLSAGDWTLLAVQALVAVSIGVIALAIAGLQDTGGNK